MVDQNDHPVAFTSRNVIVFQNESAEIVGNHMADIDLWEYRPLGPMLYEGRIQAAEGRVTIPILKPRCNVSFFDPIQVCVQA